MEGNLREIQERLNAAYDMTEFVPANGQNLDRLAMVRQELRNIGQILKNLLEELSKEVEHG